MQYVIWGIFTTITNIRLLMFLSDDDEDFTFIIYNFVAINLQTERQINVSLYITLYQVNIVRQIIYYFIILVVDLLGFAWGKTLLYMRLRNTVMILQITTPKSVLVVVQ